jgi:acetoin utilization deacetylase AcuC-like enzyme
MLTQVRSHPDCLEHKPSLGHPESPDRLQTVLEALQAVQESPWQLEVESPLPPEDDVLGVIKWLHDPEYIERVRAAAKDAPGHVDSHDCVVSKGSYTAAMAAAGLAVQAALDMINSRLHRAFVAARPPSHHAERGRARGYCFFNNVALAAELIVQAIGQKILIVDFDVHHGNGTQKIFYDREEVGYLSIHQYPFFPGTGGGDETGEGRGLGTNRNIPLAAGADDAIIAGAVEGGLEEIGARLQPQVILISAGFDAHHLDPLGGMQVTAKGFQRVSTAIVQAAEAWAGGRVLSFLEGGFEPTALAESVPVHVAELAGGEETGPAN